MAARCGWYDAYVSPAGKPFRVASPLVGHLFQGRFKSTVIEAEKYLLEVSRYLHLNPVRGVVLGALIERRERLREYRWSSYRGYAGLEKMKSFFDREPIQGGLPNLYRSVLEGFGISLLGGRGFDW